MRLVPFTLERWENLALQPEQAHESPTLNNALRLEAEGESYAFVDLEGHTIACGGLYPFGSGQAMAWSYVGKDAGPHLRRLVRESRAVLASHQDRWPVMRAATLVEFEAGHRLLKLLGFRHLGAAPMTVRGRSYMVYERTRDGGH